MTRLVAALVALLLASAAAAQNVTVIGPVTPGNVPVFNSTTVIKDSGTTPAGAQTVNWINVKSSCGATGNGSTDDTAAINTCIGLFNTATNGTLYFPAGTYKTTAALTAITANGIIRGDGPTNLIGQEIAAVSPATQINNTTTAASVFTINSQNLMLRDLSINNTAGSTPIAGSAGITVTSATEYDNKVDMENLQVAGFFIDIDRQAGALWVMHNIVIAAPVLYGLKIRNIVNADAGDWSIDSSSFVTGAFNPTSAIRMESSGGGKITAIKVNCNAAPCTTNYANGVDVQAGATSDLSLSNSSIENFLGNGVLINGNWPNVTISNMQFNNFGGGNTNRCIAILNNARITISNIIAGITPCVELTNVTDVTIDNIPDAQQPVKINNPLTLGQTPAVNTVGSIIGAGRQVLVQGWLTQENKTTGASSYQSINLGSASLDGGATPTAQVFQGIIGPANDFFTGSAQKDWFTSVNGGGAWWLNFNNDPTHGGTNTNAIKVAPISAGGPSLTIFSGGSSGAPASGWVQWGGQGRVTADVPFTSTTVLATVTGLSQTVVAGRTYSFDAYLSWTDAAAGGIQCAIAGSATATAIRYDGWIVDSGANGIKGNAAATALAGVVASATTTGTNGVVQIKGTITVNAGGTLLVQCAQNTSNGTATTIKQGSYWIVQDMP